MKRCATISAGFAVIVAGQTAHADEVVAPPAGWEIPQSVTVSTDKPGKTNKKSAPACCSFDPTCCSRQMDIDSQKEPILAKRVIEVRLADLPEAVIREVDKGAPPIEDAPPVRLLNEDGQPFPWSKAPKQIRMLPPGPLGDINWNMEWFVPSFDDTEFQGMGWGTVHYVTDTRHYAADAEIAGRVRYDSIQQGPGDKLIFDIVDGTVSGSPKIKATYHLHAEAVNIVDKVVHGYLATTKTNDETTKWVHFLLPQVIDGFESKDAKHEGGFFPSRFSHTWTYSLYKLPYGPGRSNLATFRMDDDDKRRWIGVSKKREPKTWMRRVLVSASQTVVEAEPRIRVMFYEEFAF